MKKVVLHINNMHSEKDSIMLEKHLNKKKEIKSAMVDFKSSLATITYLDSTSLETIEKYVEETGIESLGVDIISNAQTCSIIPLIVFGILLVPIFYITVAITFHLPYISFLGTKTRSTILLVLTVVFLIYGIDIILDGIKRIIRGRSTLNALGTISILMSFIYSLYYYILFQKGIVNTNYYYFEITMFLIYFFKIGNYIEEKNKKDIELEIKQISKTNINKVNKKKNDSFEEISLYDVKKGDIIVCLPGDKAMVDGTVIEGYSHFDESLVTGSSLSVEKEKNSLILAGSMNCENEISYIVEKNAKNSYTSTITKIVSEEKNNKKEYFKRIDYFSIYFVPFVTVFSIIIFILTYLITSSISLSVTNLVNVFLLCCPFGVAVLAPISGKQSIKNLSKKGILVKELTSLEKMKKINTIVFDKTGTLTNGYLCISRINNHSEMTDKELLELLGSIEKHSTHALARGITKYLRSEKIKTSHDLITEDLVGYGVKAKDDKDLYYACNSELLERLDIINSYKEEERKLRLEGNDVIYLVKNNKIIATFGLKDTIKKEAKKLINYFKEKKYNVILLTGDDEVTSKKISKELEIEEVHAGLNAKEKMEFLKELQKKKKKVMMIGDGINDAPSLACAFLGIAIKNVSDIPISAADIIISNSLSKIVDLFNMSKFTLKRERRNLFLLTIVEFIYIILVFLPFIKINSVIIIFEMLITVILVLAGNRKIKS